MKKDSDLSEYELKIKARCCNIKLLEAVYKKYL